MNENNITHNGAPDPFIMCSGGMDSVYMAHRLLEEEWDTEYGAWNKRPTVIYLDTTIGLCAQRVYMMALADHYNWQLWCLRTHEDYWDHTKDEGFYGSSQHDKIFNLLKGRQMSKLATVSGNPHFYFGTRRDESQNRRDIEKTRVNEELGATVHNPFAEVENGEIKPYIIEHNIPWNPNWEASMPSDCACGATAAREELLELEVEGYEVFAQKLRDLEREVKTGDKRETWAWSSFEKKEQREMDADADPNQMQLSDLMCGPNCSGVSEALNLGGNE